MLSKKDLFEIADQLFDHLLECPAAVDHEARLLYVLISSEEDDELYEYRLPELESLDEFGRELVTRFGDHHPDCGLAWLVAMFRAGLIDDQPVAHLAAKLDVVPVEETTIIYVLVTTKPELTNLIQREGIEKAAEILEVPIEVLQEAVKELHLSV